MFVLDGVRLEKKQELYTRLVREVGSPRLDYEKFAEPGSPETETLVFLSIS